MGASAAHVRFVSVHKWFGPNHVLKGVNLEIRKGELLSLVGVSGSGKSVLLKLLLRLLEVDAGRIEINDVDLAHLTVEELMPFRRRISMLFQGSALFDSLSVGANVAYPLRVAGGYSTAEMRQRVASRLELVGLPGTESMAPSELSGGMRKRVGLARAIVTDPELVLYDEPTMGLDPISRRRIIDLIRSIQQRLGITSLVVTHDLAAAYLLSDRMAMLSEGEVLPPLPPREFFESSSAVIREFITAMPSFHFSAAT